MITYPCPHCGERLTVESAKAGKAHVCSLCGQSSLVPAASGAPADPLPAAEPGSATAAGPSSLLRRPLRPAAICLGVVAGVVALLVVGQLTSAVAVALRGYGRHGLGTMAAPQSVRELYDEQTGTYRCRAQDLARLCLANPVDADAAFKGRLIEVSGVVTDITLGLLGEKYLVVDGVVCLFDVSSAETFAGLSPGSRVVVRGTYLDIAQYRFAGLPTGLEMWHCQFLDR